MNNQPIRLLDRVRNEAPHRPAMRDLRFAPTSGAVSSGITPKPTRLRSDELRRGSPRHSSLRPRYAGSPLRSDKPQGILAKANKVRLV